MTKMMISHFVLFLIFTISIFSTPEGWYPEDDSTLEYLACQYVETHLSFQAKEETCKPTETRPIRKSGSSYYYEVVTTYIHNKHESEMSARVTMGCHKETDKCVIGQR